MQEPPCPTAARRAPRGMAAQAFNPSTIQQSTRQQLESALELEIAESQRLSTSLKEYKAKFERALQVQTQLEEEVVQRDSQIRSLGTELKDARKQMHQAESDVAQLTMDHINGQTKWLEQTSEMTDEISQLRKELVAAHETNLKLKDAAAVAAASTSSTNSASTSSTSTAPATASNPGNPSTTTSDVHILTSSSMEQHAQALLIKELRARHEQIKEEIAQVRDINERLQEENEGFQLLLAEKTISGDLPEGSFSGSSLEDELAQAGALSGEAQPAQSAEAQSAQSSAQTELLKTSQELAKARFECRSLQNHNKALRQSLERLVHRLLENPDFSKTIEETISQRTITTFNNRVASASARAAPRLDCQPVSTASQWTNMLFNCQMSGQPGRRVVTAGVDDQVPRAGPLSPLPQDRQARSTSRASFYSTSSNRSTSPHTEDDIVIELPKRVQGQSKLRKLHFS